MSRPPGPSRPIAGAVWSLAGLLASLALGLVAAGACGPTTPPPPDPPDPDTAGMEPAVRERIAEAREAVVAEPDSAAAWGRLGRVLHAHELFADAALAYRTAAALDPGDVRWSYYLAVVLEVEGSDLEASSAAFRRALELRPDYAPAWLRYGDLLARRDDLAGAERAYRRALELEPGLAPAALGLGQVLLRGDRAEDAIPPLERAAEALPESGTALHALGRAYMLAGREERAREVAERARDARGVDRFSDPLMSAVVAEEASSTLLWPRARQALADGRIAEALALGRRIAAQEPSDAEVQELLGMAYLQDGSSDSAREHLRRALELDPGRGGARAQLGLLLLAAGRPAEAAGELRRAVEGAFGTADEPELRAHLGRALVAASRFAEAVEQFEAAAAAGGGPLPAWADDRWGLALLRLGRYGEAAARFRSALDREPDNAEGLFHFGLALEASGRPGEALTAYRRAMEIEPNELIAGRIQALSTRKH